MIYCRNSVVYLCPSHLSTRAQTTTTKTKQEGSLPASFMIYAIGDDNNDNNNRQDVSE